MNMQGKTMQNDLNNQWGRPLKIGQNIKNSLLTLGYKCVRQCVWLYNSFLAFLPASKLSQSNLSFTL